MISNNRLYLVRAVTISGFAGAATAIVGAGMTGDPSLYYGFIGEPVLLLAAAAGFHWLDTVLAAGIAARGRGASEAPSMTSSTITEVRWSRCCGRLRLGHKKHRPESRRLSDARRGHDLPSGERGTGTKAA